MTDKEREEEAKRKAAQLVDRKARAREIKDKIDDRAAFDAMQPEGRERAMFSVLLLINDSLRELVEQGKPKPPVVAKPPPAPPKPPPEYNRVSKKKGKRRG